MKIDKTLSVKKGNNHFVIFVVHGISAYYVNSIELSEDDYIAIGGPTFDDIELNQAQQSERNRRLEMRRERDRRRYNGKTPEQKAKAKAARQANKLIKNRWK